MIENKSNILCIGAHPDDIELMCGGTLLKLKEKNDAEIHFLVLTDGELKTPGTARKEEQILSASKLGAKCDFRGFSDGRLHLHLMEIIDVIENVVEQIKPDLIFSHGGADHHQDHLAVNQATKAALRKSSVTTLFYPSINYTNIKNTSVVSDISDYMSKKLGLISLFESQKFNWYLDPEYVKSLAIVAGRKYGFKYSEEFLPHSITI